MVRGIFIMGHTIMCGKKARIYKSTNFADSIYYEKSELIKALFSVRHIIVHGGRGVLKQLHFIK